MMICEKGEFSKEDLMADEVLQRYLSDISETQVPAFPPLTRKQFDVSSKYWPVVFHEDKK